MYIQHGIDILHLHRVQLYSGQTLFKISKKGKEKDTDFMGLK